MGLFRRQSAEFVPDFCRFLANRVEPDQAALTRSAVCKSVKRRLYEVKG